ncbi:MAG: response regulator [Armatimonadetes bacterium]|nr:response regulator [Armatimonadota bacterium]
MRSIATILIVDDDPFAIQTLHDALQGLGRIRYAASGADALALAAEYRIDLALLDAHMPEMDGFETCRALLDGRPDLPVIFVTVDNDFATEVRALEAGAHDFISKPVNPPVVRARVNLHLSLKAHMDRERRARAAADDATRAKSAFLARMSHDLRTPMAGVIGMADLLLETSLTPAQRRHAETIRGCGQSLVALIGDILDVSKIEAGKLEIEAIDFDIAEMVDGVGAALAVLAAGKGLELVCGVDPALPATLRGDPVRLRQAITNLVGNAAKFTDDGEIVVRCSLEAEDGSGILVRFSVRDTGIGIEPERVPAIFGEYAQAGASTTRERGGSGLGLAIVRQLAELMGGRAGVESEPGRGSEFWFTARLARAASAPAVPTPGFGSARALILDHSASNRATLMACLAGWGLRPEQATDAEAGLQTLAYAAQAGDPYLVALVDALLPDAGCERFCRTVADTPAFVATRMALMTRVTSPDGDAQRAAMGCVAAVAKPVGQSELRRALARALGAAIAAPGAPPAERPPVFSGVRALLADDNSINQKVGRASLRKLGLEVDIAADGVQAVEAAAASRYDVILMDLSMPRMDGLEATRRIRAMATGSTSGDVPIIAMTASASTTDREACRAAGMNGFLSKPVSVVALGQTLAGCLAPEAR